MDARGRPARNPGARSLHLSARAVCGEVEDPSFEQMTSLCNMDARPPSSPHAGDRVRAQNASAIPRSAAPKIVAANGHATSLLCGDGCRSAAAAAEIWFELDTGSDPATQLMMLVLRDAADCGSGIFLDVV